jgi:hypothetical protein
MSAHPFGVGGQFLKFKEYLYWAATVEKCTVQTGYAIEEDGEVLSTHTITAPNGRHVIVLDLDPDESVSLSEIAFFDRRLGIQWPGTKG